MRYTTHIRLMSLERVSGVLCMMSGGGGVWPLFRPEVEWASLLLPVCILLLVAPCRLVALVFIRWAASLTCKRSNERRNRLFHLWVGGSGGWRRLAKIKEQHHCRRQASADGGLKMAYTSACRRSAVPRSADRLAACLCRSCGWRTRIFHSRLAGGRLLHARSGQAWSGTQNEGIWLRLKQANGPD